MALIELKDVSKYYNDGSTSSKGIENITLSFDRGEFVAITGESGSGKTTLLNVITLMDSYDEGDIVFNNKSTVDFSNEDMVAFRNEYVSMVFQDYNIVQSVSVLDNVVLALLNKGISYKEAKKEAKDALIKCGLKEKIKSKVSKLSGGEKQRVVIARALALNSPVLAFDEPTGNLDVKTSNEIINLIKEIKKDRLILYVTHDYESIKDIATRHLVLKDGEVIEDEILSNADKIEEPLVTKKEKTSIFAVLFSGIKLIFSMPKNFILLLCSLLLFSIVGYISAIAFAASNPLINIAVSSTSTSERLFNDLTDTSVVVSLKEDEYKDNLPNDYFIDKGSFLSSLRIEVSDYIGSIDIGFYLPNDVNFIKEVSGESGFYLLYHRDYASTYEVNELKSTYENSVGEEINTLKISGYANDGTTISPINECNNIINGNSLLGIGESSNMGAPFQIVFTKDIASKLSDKIYSTYVDVMSDPFLYGYYNFDLIFRNYDLNSLLSINLDGKEVRCLTDFAYGGTTYSPLYLPDFYYDSIDKMEVKVLNKTLSFKDFFNILKPEDSSLDINDINSNIYLNYNDFNGGVYFPLNNSNLMLFLLDKITGFSVIYFDSASAARDFKNKIGENAHLGNEVISRPQNINTYINLIVILLPLIFMILIFAVVFIFASWITSMLLRNVLNKYSPDFAVLSTLGYRKGSIYSIRLILITLPTAIAYILVSIILTITIYAMFFNFNPSETSKYMSLFMPYIIGFFFILLALGFLISYFIDRKIRKLKTISILKEAGGSVK